jgi:hypothetical protein
MVIDNVIVKYCQECGEIKPITEFYENKRMKDGYFNICKECSRARSKNYYDEKRTDDAFMAKERERGREKYKNRRK